MAKKKTTRKRIAEVFMAWWRRRKKKGKEARGKTWLSGRTKQTEEQLHRKNGPLAPGDMPNDAERRRRAERIKKKK